MNLQWLTVSTVQKTIYKMLFLWLAMINLKVLLAQENPVQDSTAKLLPVEAFFNDSLISNVQLSHDGQWVAWLQNHNNAANIFLMPVDGDRTKAYPLTNFKDGIDGYVWGHNDQDIFLLMDKEGNENHQIYRLELTKKPALQLEKVHKLTKNDNAQYGVLGLPKQNKEYIYTMANHDSAARKDTYLINIKTGELKRTYENTLGFLTFLFNEKGWPVVGMSRRADTSNEVFVYEKDEWTSKIVTAPGELLNLLSYQEKNNSFYFQTSMGDADTKELKRYDLTSDKIVTMHSDPKKRSDIYNVLFNDDGILQMVSYYYGHKEDYPIDKHFAKHWQTIENAFDKRKEIDVVEMHEDSGSWLLNVSSDVDAGAYYVYKESNGKLKKLIDKDTTLDTTQLSPRQSITYKARDGLTIQAYLTLPKNQKHHLPLVVIPHGGPWARDYWTLDSGFFSRVAQLLTNRGYAVLQPNFRSSTGFGENFINLGSRQWGTGSMQHDVTDGVKHLITKGIVDKKRVAILGGSYGGYATLAGLTFTPDIYTAGISMVGPSSLITLLESFPAHFRPYLKRWFKDVGDPEIPADRKDMQARSPLNFIGNIKAPLLLVQGANDPRVTQLESDQIAQKMYAKGLDVEYLLAKDEGHGFANKLNRLAFLTKMDNFLAKHLGGKAYPNVTPAMQAQLEKLEVDISRIKLAKKD
ncbi:MAG: S9 family peptidase [Pseudomonadota bacterium]